MFFGLSIFLMACAPYAACPQLGIVMHMPRWKFASLDEKYFNTQQHNRNRKQQHCYYG